jgi:type IV pilus biogenesis protein CpaD/CtpE
MKNSVRFIIVFILLGLLAGCAQTGGASVTPIAVPTVTSTVAPVVNSTPSFDALIPVAVAFVDEISAGNYAAAVSRFDTNMQSVLPEAKLKDAWAQLIAQAGAFQKRAGALTQTAQLGNQIVFVTCEFAKARVYAQVTFNAQGQIVGLYFSPAPSPAQIN